ncbi:hypothetical protein V5799_014521 [Amblyomma americanum]|uniref:Uncharacterized protein n=1 Tax=Amblyomma americanum TaxID=6943 RepID=A0AAQ4E2S9_AMBAM
MSFVTRVNHISTDVIEVDALTVQRDVMVMLTVLITLTSKAAGQQHCQLWMTALWTSFAAIVASALLGRWFAMAGEIAQTALMRGTAVRALSLPLPLSVSVCI